MTSESPAFFLEAASVASAPVRAPSQALTEPRRFLFVTAPFGPFSRELARLLRKAGAGCERILLNGGDLMEWGPLHATVYRGEAKDWPQWIAAHLQQHRITDLITHGDQHAYGAAAISAAQSLKLRVHVFEQGYFRPHWITLERDGVNAHSRLSRAAEDYWQITPAAHRPPPTPVGRITPAAVRHITAYHLFSYLGCLLFPRYRAPYSYPAALQALGHIRRFINQKLFGAAERVQLHKALAGAEPMFLALLQRPGDSQLLRHSSFSSSKAFITEVIESFAKDAPGTAKLLFKVHPLDHGLEPHATVIKRTSRMFGVEERVFCVEGGRLPALLSRAAGVISVNSTGGISGLEAGLPTIALGVALYDIEGLTHQSGLKTFWTAPEAPDRRLYEVYSAAVIASTQINGAFSTRHGVNLAAPEAARRLLSSR